MGTVVTRFAPSPTGHLHIGGIRTALINYIITNQAKIDNSDSKFLLRIEDTDKKRSKQEYVDSIINGLKWLGIKWDNNIYFQSKRISRHQEIATKLLETKNGFKCICTTKQINMKREENLIKKLDIKRLCENCEFDQQVQNLITDYCIRIKIPNKGNQLISDILQGDVTVKNKEIDNFIILRNNGTPTYMLSSVVDDHDMNVNMIIRGDDHLNNTFKQSYIYKKLGWELPRYAHLPLIHGIDGSKLSKRHGAIDINELKKIGYLPKAIINNLILLGWSPKSKDEIIEIDEIVKKFDIKKLSKSSSIFNYQKLDFLNNFYLQKKDSYKDFEKYIEDNELMKSYLFENPEKIKKIYKAYNAKVKILFEFIEIIKIYFDKRFVTKSDEILNDNFKVLLKNFLKNLKNVNDWNESNLELCIKKFINEENIKFAEFGRPIRHILTNKKDGPSISLIMFILGKNISFLRINNYIK